MPDDIFGARWLNDAPYTQSEPHRTNRFHDARNVTDLIYRVVGAAAGEYQPDFDMAQAIKIADAAIDRLIEMAWARQNYVITTDTTTRT